MTPDRSFTPSLEHSSGPGQSTHFATGIAAGAGSGGTSLMEVSAFMTEQLDKQLEKQRMHDAQMRDQMDAKMERQLKEAKRDKAELKAEMEAQRLENDKLRTEVTEACVRAEMQAKVDGAAAARLRDQQLLALQGRLEALSAAKLLTDDELFAVEDVIADSSGEPSGDDQLTMLLALSARMATDSAFARQLRRMIVAQ